MTSRLHSSAKNAKSAPPARQRAEAASASGLQATSTGESESSEAGDGQFDHDFSAIPARSLHRVAAHGTRGAGQALPFHDVIQRSFGRHGLGRASAHVGGNAGEAATALSASAYTFGEAVAFSQTPDLATAAHEAAHVVQQRRGVALPNGRGDTGDAYEQHADAVSRAVVAGRSAEPLLDRLPAAGASHTAVQRLAFVNEKRLTKAETSFTPEMKKMLRDSTVRNYTGVDEFQRHAENKTDYLGNVKGGVWVRFSPTGTNLLGEQHTFVTLEDVVPAVGTKSFIYEPFMVTDMTPGSAVGAAYEKETAQRFKNFGVEGEKNKAQFGAEGLYAKLGYNFTILVPFVDGTYPLSALKRDGYVGQPLQRYLKIGWGWSKDNQADVAEKQKTKRYVTPKLAALAAVHTKMEAKLDPFITALPVDGFLGDALDKPGRADLLPLLTEFAKTFSEAMVRMAAQQPSSRLSVGERMSHTGSTVTSEKDKETLFSNWRDFNFEDAVAAATKRGVRYAGMGMAHLGHLQTKVGIGTNQHDFDMTPGGRDFSRFQALTDKLKGARP